MTWSQNEVASLFRKAARGAGFPPAQSARYGKAAVRHLGNGGAAADLLRALENPGDSAVLRLPLIADDVLRAANLIDGEIALSIHAGDKPLVRAYVEALPMGIESFRLEDAENAARVVLTPNLAVAGAPPQRISLDPDSLGRLQTLGKLTEVPASEASRLSGAGAGLTDND